ncbi:aspartate racemase [Clostridium tetani]|uniref:aspartate/glutamate racemase family protein n=1 Tax=Clostridium tetani TaxID=1513 RepID=UPI00100A308D|nr:amino acid racemase [Clostridium tetani]RXI38443.1 aspartate racemase [Clostridium tetani]
MSKIVGIIGGMGPKATVDLYNKIVDYTDASSDQDHLHVVIDGNAKIPDRTSYILGNGKSPLDELVKTGERLKNAGADFLIMPCNTAHYFYDELYEKLNMPFINMIEEVGKYIVTKHGKIKVGLLGTLGTYQGKVYERYCKELGLDIIIPSKEVRQKVSDAVYIVKSGQRNFTKEFAMDMLKEFDEKDVNAVILGCTELPLIFQPLENDLKDFEFISSTDILAKETIKRVKK